MPAVQSTYNPIRAPVSLADIVPAYEKHGNDFLIIDVDLMKPSKYAQYIPVYIKKVDGSIISPTYFKITADGLRTIASIRPPNQRAYAKFRIGFAHTIIEDGVERESENGIALKLICETYEAQWQKLVDSGAISAGRANPKNAGKRSTVLLNTNPVYPMRTYRTDKDSGEIEEMEHPDYWLSIYERYYRNQNEKPPSVQLNGECYVDSDQPIMSYELSPEFYDLGNYIHHPKTGAKVYTKLGDKDSETNEPVLNNLNIHQFIPRGSTMIGALKMEVIVTRNQAKLDISLIRKFYVNCNEEGYDVADDDDEDLAKFTAKMKSTSIVKTANDDDEFESFDDE